MKKYIEASNKGLLLRKRTKKFTHNVREIQLRDENGFLYEYSKRTYKNGNVFYHRRMALCGVHMNNEIYLTPDSIWEELIVHKPIMEHPLIYKMFLTMRDQI